METDAGNNTKLYSHKSYFLAIIYISPVKAQ